MKGVKWMPRRISEASLELVYFAALELKTRVFLRSTFCTHKTTGQLSPLWFYRIREQFTGQLICKWQSSNIKANTQRGSQERA